MSDSFTQKKINRMLCFVAIICLAFTIVLVTVYFLKFHYEYSPLNADWGTFGDYLGGTLNPIFGLVSTLGLLYTIALQQQEIERDRKQIADDRFDDTFFKLLELLNACGEKIGEQKFEALSRSLGTKQGPHPNASILSRWTAAAGANPYLNPYFTQLQNIYNRINEHQWDEQKKKAYLSILQSQLSPTIRAVLAHAINVFPELSSFHTLCKPN